MRKRKHKHRTQYWVACPIKEIGCTAKKPRWVDYSTILRQKQKGACKGCGRRKYTLKKLLQIPGVIKARTNSVGYAEVLIACPLQKRVCFHRKPRWVYQGSVTWRAGKVPGSCKSCSKEKGGHINSKGYRAISLGSRKGKNKLEHRVIMEGILGRKLRKGETVHHKNGKRADNRKLNLELRMSGNHPRGWSLRQMREYLKTIPKRLGGLK